MQTVLNLDKKSMKTMYGVFEEVVHIANVPYTPPEDLLILYREQKNDRVVRIRYITNGKRVSISYDDTNVLLVENKANNVFSYEVEFDPDTRAQYRITRTPEELKYRTWLKGKYTESATNADFIFGFWRIGVLFLSLLLPAFNYKPYGKNVCFYVPDDFPERAKAAAEVVLTEHKKKMLYDGWDVIRLTDDEFARIRLLTPRGYFEDSSFDTLALRKFAFRLDSKEKGIGIFYYEAHNGNCIKIGYNRENDPANTPLYVDVRIEDYIDPMTSEPGKMIHILDTHGPETFSEWLGKTTDDDPESLSYLEWMVCTFFGLNYFMLHYSDVTMEVEERECVAHESHSSHNRRRERNNVRLFKTYKLKRGWKTRAERKKAEIHCLAWGVRGHFRRYKSGKVIFIEAYVKGKEREKYSGKDYALLPKAK